PRPGPAPAPRPRRSARARVLRCRFRPREQIALVSIRRNGDDATPGIDAIALRVVTVAEFVARDRPGGGGLRRRRIVRTLDGHALAGAVDSIALGIDPVVVLVHAIGRDRLARIGLRPGLGVRALGSDAMPIGV